MLLFLLEQGLPSFFKQVLAVLRVCLIFLSLSKDPCPVGVGRNVRKVSVRGFMMIVMQIHGLWCVPITFLVFNWFQFYLAHLV